MKKATDFDDENKYPRTEWFPIDRKSTRLNSSH